MKYLDWEKLYKQNDELRELYSKQCKEGTPLYQLIKRNCVIKVVKGYGLGPR